MDSVEEPMHDEEYSHKDYNYIYVYILRVLQIPLLGDSDYLENVDCFVTTEATVMHFPTNTNNSRTNLFFMFSL